jgi:hypothetical protein
MILGRRRPAIRAKPQHTAANYLRTVSADARHPAIAIERADGRHLNRVCEQVVWLSQPVCG